MKHRITALFLLLTIFASMAIFRPAQAQETEIKFSNVKVDIWPEYDRPTVLVIYHITLDPGLTLPVDLSIRIPAEAGEPNAVANGQTDDPSALQNIQYNSQPGEEWTTLKFTATMPVVRIEYYDPRINKQGNNRQFEYAWPGDYLANKLVVEVQQPVGASDMHASPKLGPGATGNDGLIYYTVDMGSVQAGENAQLSLDYKRSSNQLSAEIVKVNPASPIVESESAYSALNNVLPWLLGILGIVLIAGGGFWYWRSGKVRGRPEPARRRHKPADSQEPAENESHIYCHQCGKRASANDRFCRTCGTRLRTE